MFGVVCFRWDGKFDHSVGFANETTAREYVQNHSGDGCRYEIWKNGVRLA